MNLQALKFVRQHSRVEATPCVVEINAPDTLSQLSIGKPCAYVIRGEALTHLRQFKDHIIDRGRKHKAKPLAKLLLGKQAIPLIDGAFSAVGQLERSIRTLLEHAARVGEVNIYFVGTTARVFDELWRKIQSGRVKPRATPREGRLSSGWFTIPGEGDLAQGLLDLLPAFEEPPELARTYIGSSLEAQMVRRFTMMAALCEEPVLILGDTGTGKELVAQAIHRYGSRSSALFKTLNCSAIPSELLESELFGHRKGAFTGAHTNKLGLWQTANRGTLFLDEIGDLSLVHQAKILRALQEGKIKPVGATEESDVSARVIAATNRDLPAMVQARQFREDLYYRIRHILIRTPALRNHPSDIPELAEGLWARLTADNSSRLPKKILSKLQSYPWPGNVRELKSVLSCLHTLFGKVGLGVEHLQAVWLVLGQAIPTRSTALTGNELALHCAECLRHLRNADETIRALKVSMRPLLVEKSRLDRRSINAMRRSLQRHLYELEMLCLHPVLFHSESVFRTIYRLKGELTEFAALLRQEASVSYGHWRENLAGLHRHVTSVLFNEIQTLLRRI